MISNQVLDFYDDKSKVVFQKIASQIPKELYQEKISDEVAPENYALRVLTKHGTILNKYPVDSKLNATLSDLYFSETHNQIHPQAQEIAAFHIKEACIRFGVPTSAPVEKLAKQKSSNFFDEAASTSFSKSFQKVAFDYSKTDKDSVYALPKFKKYAMPDEKYLRKAERYFEENYKGFDPETRVEYSENLIKRASELQADVKSEVIKKYASKKYSKKVAQHLKSREPLCKEASHVRVLKKMHTFIEKTAAFDFAKALHEFDKKTGLEKYYDVKIKDPYLSVLDHEVITKEASFKYLEKTSGISLTSKDLKGAFEKKAAVVTEYFGKAMSDGLLNKGIEEFEALPDDTKDILAKIAIGAV